MELSKSKTIKFLGDKDVKNKMDRVMYKQECDSLTFSRPYWRTLAIGHFCRDLAFEKLKVLSSKGDPNPNQKCLSLVVYKEVPLGYISL